MVALHSALLDHRTTVTIIVVTISMIARILTTIQRHRLHRFRTVNDQRATSKVDQRR
jgi:hypothetical protein